MIFALHIAEGILSACRSQERNINVDKVGDIAGDQLWEFCPAPEMKGRHSKTTAYSYQLPAQRCPRVNVGTLY